MNFTRGLELDDELEQVLEELDTIPKIDEVLIIH